MRLGVFLPNWIGDVVMATPALRALRRLVGDEGRLIGIMRPYVAEVLAGTHWLHQQIVYDKPQSRFTMADRAAYRELRAARLERVVILTNSWRTGWMAWRSGARERIGQAYDARSWLLTRRLPRPRKPDGQLTATVDAYLMLAEAAGAGRELPQLELATTPTDELAADAVWQRLGLPPGEQIVIFNSGGAYGAAKHWPPEYFAELARRIVTFRDQELAVLVNCGPAERQVARQIVERAKHPRVFSLAEVEQLPIGLTKACIRRSRMLVTTDSGPRFLAIAFGKPVVALFGPTDPEATETHYDWETCLSLALDCQPCFARRCPLVHHRCMHDLSVDYVYDAVVRQLQSWRGGDGSRGNIGAATHARLSVSPRLPV